MRGFICQRRLRGDGDFRSDECRELLKSSDIVVTNPPFSLAREFIETLVTEGKSFLIVGALPWLGYSQIFPLIRYFHSYGIIKFGRE